MPFVPHTEQEIADMLAAIGVQDIDSLFDEIPKQLRIDRLQNVPSKISEMEIARLMKARANQDGRPLNFIGAGAYEHHIPAAVWELTTRGEFYSAYTPYQAEASQGTLQLIYEYQSMMSNLMAMEVSNASLYDGASALAEAVLMAVRANRKSKSKRILMPRTVHPIYRNVVRSIVKNQGLEIVELPFDMGHGNTDPACLKQYEGQDIAALVIPQPNFFGCLEDVDQLTEWAAANGALSIAVVNPVAAALLKPPGQWHENGVDIACGEGQPLGVPLSSGGPYFGFMCTRKSLVRQMPGRIVGKTVDRQGREGYSLTLQAREQHIRRSKATSNICTNQGLLVTAATIHMALLGYEGLRRVALQSHQNLQLLTQKLDKLEAIHKVFERPHFHECVLQVDVPLAGVIRALSAQNVVAGYPLEDDYPELKNCLLVCTTETKTEQDLNVFVEHLERIFARQYAYKCPTQPKMA